MSPALFVIPGIEELEKLNGINILLVGTGGGEFSDNKAAHEVIGQIDPQIVVPGRHRPGRAVTTKASMDRSATNSSMAR